MLCPKLNKAPCSTWVDQSLTKRVPVGRSTPVKHGSTQFVTNLNNRPGSDSMFQTGRPELKKKYSFKSKKINKKNTF